MGCSLSYSSSGIEGLGSQSPKYFSTASTISSGSKSPDTQMAMLLGT